MGPEEKTALITAIASLIVAGISFLSSRSAKMLAARAHEASQRSEQLRLKATDAGQKLLEAFAEIIVLSETILDLLDRREEKVPSKDEMVEYFAPIGSAAGKIRKLMYSSAMYTSPEIRKAIEDLLRPIHAGGVDFSKRTQFVQSLRENHSPIAALFRDAYLRGSF